MENTIVKRHANYRWQGHDARYFDQDREVRCNSSLLSPVFKNKTSKQLGRSSRLSENHTRSQIRFDSKIISLASRLHPDPFSKYQQSQSSRYADYSTRQSGETRNKNLIMSQDSKKVQPAPNRIFTSQIVEQINNLTSQPQPVITTPNARNQQTSQLLNYIGLDRIPLNQYDFQLRCEYKGHLQKANKKVKKPKRQSELSQKFSGNKQCAQSRNGYRQQNFPSTVINCVNEYDFNLFKRRSSSQIKIQDQTAVQKEQVFFQPNLTTQSRSSNKNDRSKKRLKLYTNLKIKQDQQLVLPQFSPPSKCLSTHQSSDRELVKNESTGSCVMIDAVQPNLKVRLEIKPDLVKQPNLYKSTEASSVYDLQTSVKNKNFKIKKKAELAAPPFQEEAAPPKKHDFQEHLQKFPPRKIVNENDKLQKEQLLKLQQRKDMLKKYNQISATINKITGTLKFEIQKGNNSEALRQVMQNRLLIHPADPSQDEAPEESLWEEVQNSHLINFRWKPTSQGINFERLGKFGNKQLVNHIQGHESLTTKDQLYFNMKQYYESLRKNVFTVLPLTFPIDFSDKSNVEEQWDLIVKVIQIFDKNLGFSAADLNTQIAKLQKSKEKTIKTPYYINEYEHQKKNLWLLKPTGFNRGIGIHVFNSIADLKSILWTHYRIESFQPANITPVQVVEEESKSIQNKTFIVQKYIEQPILFRDRKFDIRQWVLISHDGQCYMFQHAYVRTSSEIYNLEEQNLDQVYVHLTNNAVQKYSKSYGKFEEANIVAVETLVDELAETTPGCTADELKRNLKRQMKSVIVESLAAVKQHLKFNKYSFELVGYDFMMVPGSPLDVRLIEANTNPCLEVPNALLKMLIPRMLDDMLKIVLDPLFNCSFNGTNAVYPVTGHSDSENLWEPILQLQI